MKKLFIGFIFLALTSLVHSQTNEGTNFWFSVMEHRDVGNNTMVLMITSKYNTNGTVEIPRMNWSEAFSVQANQVSIINLPKIAETTGSETIKQNGIQIASAQPVAAFIHQYHNFRSEASVVLPVESIGQEYYIMTYQGVTNEGEIFPAEFLIVATEDNTEVFIELSDESEGRRTAGSVISLTLDAGQTYQVQARLSTGDFTGTHIIGDKPIAVYGGNTWTQVPSICELRDNLVEQMYPVSTWGRRFVSVPNAQVRYDVFRILATEDNTNVQVQGNTTQDYLLQSGEYVEYNSGEANYIEASAPIMVAQFNIGSFCSGHHLGDPSMVLLNSIEQTLDTVTLFNSSFQNIEENYINIVLKGDDGSNIFIDGRAVSDFATVQNVANSPFSFVRLRVSSGSHTIISEGCGIIATAYGYGPAESYAYSGGARFSPININPILDGGCLNDTILFDTRLSPAKYSFLWDFGNDDTTTEPRPRRTYDELGTFPVNLIVTDECLGETDTFQKDIRVTLRQAVAALDSVKICEGEEANLSATDVAEASYLWNGPNGYRSVSQYPSLSNARPSMSGKYSVIGVVSGCATFPAYTELYVAPTPAPDLGLDTTICVRDDSIAIPIYAGDFYTYRWQDNSTAAEYIVGSDGTFHVEVRDELGCVGRDSINFQERCPATFYVPTAFSPNNDGQNDFFQVFEDQVLAAQLQIFDRWGNLVFETDELSQAWDGTWQGQIASEGVYVWTLQYEGYDRKGNIVADEDAGSLLLIRR